MLRCSVVPYEGNEKFVFISYSHKDKKEVFPVIERLASEGYRVWFDEGIEPGTEWPESIAEHLSACELFICFMSRNYLGSLNCKRELNFAINKKKHFITVYTEKADLSPGIEMQISVTQSVYKYNIPEDIFYEKLLSSDYIIPCKAETSYNALFSDFLDNAQDLKEKKEIKEKKTIFGVLQTVTETPSKPKKKVTHSTAVKKERSGNVKTKKSKSSDDTPKKKGKKKFVVLILAALILVASISAIVIHHNTGNILLDGEKFYSSQIYVSFSDMNFTDADSALLLKLKKAESFSFRNCTFSSSSAICLPELIGNISFENCTGIDDLSFLSSLKENASVSLTDCPIDASVFASLSFMDAACVPAIRYLAIIRCGNVGECPDLSSWTSLKSLELSETGLRSIPADRLPSQLNFLNVSLNEELGDISGVESTSLTDLNISSCPVLDTHALRSLTGLWSLDAQYVDGFNFDDIADASSLTYLDVTGCGLETLPLSEYSALLTLIAANNSLTDISGLSECKSLVHLDISDNPSLNNDELGFLSTFIRLEDFDCSRCGFSDIGSLLTNCTKLKKVFLSDNSIADFSVLAKSSQTLQTLYMENNAASELSFLAEANALQFLDCSGNLITSLEPLSGCVSLTEIYASDNMLTSADGLISAELRFIDLSDNELTDIKDIRSADIRMLNVCGNDITAYPDWSAGSVGNMFAAGNPAVLEPIPLRINNLVIDYSSASDPAALNTAVLYKVYMVDCPLDKQVDTQEAFSSGKCVFISADEVEDTVFSLCS